MADYYPLIARAVSGLEKNTGEARRALYERARSALVAQLRSSTPPMSESEVTKERLALEEAIRRVEADTARKIKTEAQSATIAAAPSSPAAPAFPAHPQASRPESRANPPAQAKPRDASSENMRQPPPPSRPPQPAGKARRPLSDEGLKGFRDVVAEAESLGQATAQASKSAREAFSAVPSNVPELDRLEPRAEPEGLRSQPREAHKPRPREAPIARAADLAIPKAREIPIPPHREELIEPAAWPEPAFSTPRMPPRAQAPSLEAAHHGHSRTGLVAAILAVLLILALGGGVFWQRDKVAALFNAVKGTSIQGQRETQPSRPKITDRVGQMPGDASPSARAPEGTEQVAAVGQRVVLYEEDPAEPAGKRYVGSAVWRTETVPGSASQNPELAVRADVEIPERRITMTVTMRRNNDQNLPASHTIEIMFNLPADFPFGGIANVPGILMKQAEATRGAPLAGLAVKVTSGFFLVGLSATESDQQRNVQLLKERGWFDIPVVYNNGRRAILAIEKGNPGDRAFAEAFAAWGRGG